MKKLITERDILQTWKNRNTKLFVPANCIITPAAKDAANTRQIEIISASENPIQSLENINRELTNHVVLGSDHGGFEFKKLLIEYLLQHDYQIEDVGTFSTDPVDYPDYAHLVASKVAKDLTLVGIIVDGAGSGSAMTANKVPGIRAAACYDVYTAKNSREHNFANVLTLGSRVIGIDTAKQIVSTWLTTPFGEERHKRRVDKIMQIERDYSNP